MCLLHLFLSGFRTLKGRAVVKMTVILVVLSKAGNYWQAERQLDFQVVDFVQTTTLCTLALVYIRGICHLLNYSQRHKSRDSWASMITRGAQKFQVDILHFFCNLMSRNYFTAELRFPFRNFLFQLLCMQTHWSGFPLIFCIGSLYSHINNKTGRKEMG